MTMLPCPSCGVTMAEGVAVHFATCPIIQGRAVGKIFGPRSPRSKMRRRLNRLERLVLLAEEFGHRCGICGAQLGDLADCNIDHIFPRALGGTNDWENLQPAHMSCNTEKGGRYQKPRAGRKGSHVRPHALS